MASSKSSAGVTALRIALGAAAVAFFVMAVLKDRRGTPSAQPVRSNPASAVPASASASTKPEDTGPADRELIALARAHHEKSDQARAAFAEVARENPSLRAEQLELVEGALLHAGAEYFDEGFVTARRWGLDLEVTDGPKAVRVVVRPTDGRVSASWGLGIDKHTGEVKRTFTATTHDHLMVSLPPEHAALLPALRRCYGRALARDPQAVTKGELAVSFHTEGTVRHVKLEAQPRISKAFDRCVREAAQRFPFPAPAAGGPLRVPVAFVTD
jgi:hypothetical protein